MNEKEKKEAIDAEVVEDGKKSEKKEIFLDMILNT